MLLCIQRVTTELGQFLPQRLSPPLPESECPSGPWSARRKTIAYHLQCPAGYSPNDSSLKCEICAKVVFVIFFFKILQELIKKTNFFYLKSIQSCVKSVLFVQQQLHRREVASKVGGAHMVFLVANPTFHLKIIFFPFFPTNWPHHTSTWIAWRRCCRAVFASVLRPTPWSASNASATAPAGWQCSWRGGCQRWWAENVNV